MKTIIAGGRHYIFKNTDIAFLDSLNIAEVVTGGATGADAAGAKYGAERGIKITTFEPDWARFRRAAGPIRNAKMATYADTCVLFPGGKGTRSMWLLANRAGLEIYDMRGEKKHKIYKQLTF